MIEHEETVRRVRASGVKVVLAVQDTYSHDKTARMGDYARRVIMLRFQG